MDTLFMTADEVAREMNVSKAYAYKIIQRLNRAAGDGLSDGIRKSKPQILYEESELQRWKGETVNAGL